MHKPTLVMISFATLCMVPAAAQTPEPLTLGSAIILAGAQSGDASAQEIVRRSQDVVNRAGSSPTLGLSTGITVAPQPNAPPQMTISEQLTIGGGSRLTRLGQLQSSQAATAQAIAAFALSRRSLVQSVIATFFAVATDQVQLQAATENETLLQRSVVAARERHGVGVAPLVDVERAQSALAAARADRLAAAVALTLDRSALGVLIGSPTVGEVVLPTTTVPLGDVAAAALATSPAVSSSTASVQSANAAVLQARGLLQPDLSLGGGLQVIRQGKDTSVGPAVTLTLSAPLASGLPRANLAAAQATLTSAQATLAQTQRDAVQTALRAQSQATSAAARIDSLRFALDQARRVYESMLAGYRLGAVSSADLITAQTQFTNARTTLNNATLQVSQAAATLQLETGVLKL